MSWLTFILMYLDNLINVFSMICFLCIDFNILTLQEKAKWSLNNLAREIFDDICGFIESYSCHFDFVLVATKNNWEVDRFVAHLFRYIAFRKRFKALKPP